jgi:aminomethyltransferase
MSFRTPLHAEHLAAGAKMVDFSGWDMPLHYGSQIDEHHVVRNAAGVFDVSHMCVVDLRGDRARALLERVIANDPGKLRSPGRALYTCMLNEQAGVVDDLIVYHFAPNWYRAVVNAGTRDKDLAWLRCHAVDFGVEVVERRDLAILAVQGPRARELAAPRLAIDPATTLALKPFTAAIDGDWMVARTGYTGEDGWELVLPVGEAVECWQSLVAAGVAPCGLGARDTLRLEAGMNLYGQDMDEDVSPLACGLAWTVAWEPSGRAFIGRAALEARRAAGGVPRFVGVLLEDRGVLRAHQKVFTAEGEGELTSGGFSPTLGRSIGLARLPPGAGDTCEVEIRGRRLAARIVAPPFVRHGRAQIDL